MTPRVVRGLVVIWLGCFFSAGASAATTGGGTSAGEFLRLGTGARGPAMGDAFTAAADGVSSLHYNPANLGRVEQTEVEASYQNLVLGSGLGQIGAAIPRGERRGWGLSVTYVEYGATNRTTLSTTGGAASAVRAGTFDGHDIAAGVSYGRGLGDWGLGATARVVSSRIDDASATAFAADLGLSYRFPRRPIEAGIVVKNLGTRLRYDRANEDLPLLVRGGLSTKIFRGRLRLSVEAEKARNERAVVLAGGEFRVGSLLALRAGYDGRADGIDDGLTFGVGVSHENLSVDYGYIPFGDFGESHRVSLRYTFSAADGN